MKKVSGMELKQIKQIESRLKIILVVLLIPAIGLIAVQQFTGPSSQRQLPQTSTAPANIDAFVARTLSDEAQIDEQQNQNLQNPKNSSAKPNTATSLGKKIQGPVKNQEIQSELPSICEGENKSDFNCYEKYYTDEVNQKGIKPAITDLKARYNVTSYVRSQCHPLTHVIGRIGTNLYTTVAEAYAQGDSFCWSGYYHGVMEGIIARVGYNNIVSQLDKICSPLAVKSKYSFDHYNCAHGLGHGVMAINNDELFDSLTMCDKLSDTWERQSCWSGVFMENIIIDGKNHVTKYLKPSEPLYPCNAVGKDYKYTCYLMQTSYMLKVTGGDFAKVFDLCGQVEQDYRTNCYMSLGRDISGRGISNVKYTVDNCSLGRTREMQEYCYIGAVKDFISYFHSDVQAKELCDAIVEPTLKETCFKTVQSYYKSF